MIHLDYRYIKAVMADREAEAQRMRLARQARQARSEKQKAEGERRWRVGIRDPLNA